MDVLAAHAIVSVKKQNKQVWVAYAVVRVKEKNMKILEAHVVVWVKEYGEKHGGLGGHAVV